MRFRRWTLAVSVLAASVAVILAARAQPETQLTNPPQVLPVNGVTSLTLTASNRPDGRASMQYKGSYVLPTIRVWPGGQLKIDYVNNLSAHSIEHCAIGRCLDMTNLHFHGLGVSPNAPQDDVLTMLARPGQTLHYDVQVPKRQAPGLYWIHTHPHTESAEQDLDGMSMALIVDGIDRYVPQVRGLRERVLVVRTLDPPLSQVEHLRRITGVPKKDCGTSGEQVEDFPTVNGDTRPKIAIAPGERQFWRIVNAQPNAFLNLQIDGSAFQVVALDGAPLALHDPAHPIRTTQTVFLPPAGRVEAIVTGPPASTPATLRTLCVNAGAAGDINAASVLADITPSASQEPMTTVPVSNEPPVYRHVDVSAIERSAPQFTAVFTEGHHRFFINNQLFSMDAKPMVTVRVGSYGHWRVVNRTKEMHPFHIHQVHFLTYALDGKTISNPVWLDTVNVPANGSVDAVLDFTNPVIRGVGVFHCHILTHEDKGMMAKVLFR